MRADPAGDVEAADAGQPQVEHDESGPLALDRFERFFAGAGFDDRQAGPFEDAPHQPPRVGDVVDHEDERRRGGAHQPTGWRQVRDAPAPGSQTLNRLPDPGVDSTVRSPPWRRTYSRAIARPRPVPGTSGAATR